MSFDTADIYCEIKNCGFYGGAVAMDIDSPVEIWAVENVYWGQRLQSIEIDDAASGITYRDTLCDYDATEPGYPDANYKAISFEAGWDVTLSFEHDTVSLGASGHSFMSIPNQTAITYSDIIAYNNTWNQVGEFINVEGSEIDYSDSKWKDVEVINNIGVQNSAPNMKFNLLSSTGLTTITTQNVWYKCVFGTPQSYFAHKWTLGDNILTYLSTHPKDIIFWISGSLSTSNNPATTYQIGIIKNGLTGTTYGSMVVTTNGSGILTPFTWVSFVEQVATDDYFEFYVRNTTGTADVTINNIVAYGDSR